MYVCVGPELSIHHENAYGELIVSYVYLGAPCVCVFGHRFERLLEFGRDSAVIICNNISRAPAVCLVHAEGELTITGFPDNVTFMTTYTIDADYSRPIDPPKFEHRIRGGMLYKVPTQLHQLFYAQQSNPFVQCHIRAACVQLMALKRVILDDLAKYIVITGTYAYMKHDYELYSEEVEHVEPDNDDAEFDEFINYPLDWF